MKLTIERAALLRSLNHVQSVVERRNTIYSIKCSFDADNEYLAMTATDMDLAIIEIVDAASSSGTITAPAHTLYDIVRKLPEGAQIGLDSAGEEGRLILTSGRSRFTLQTLPTADFPQMTDGDLPTVFQIPADTLRMLIDRTRFAISTEETRYYLNGIYVHQAEANGIPVLRVVATDGHRLARVEMPLPNGANNMPGIIVPRKAINELRNLSMKLKLMLRVLYQTPKYDSASTM